MFKNYLNTKIIKTNPKLQPKERLFICLSEYFIKKGFVYKKSNNEFVRNFKYGFERVEICFLTTGFLSDAELFWSKSFWGIEKICSTIYEHPRKYKNEKTIFCDIRNYSKAKKEKKYPVPIFNRFTNNISKLYDDKSINRASREIVILFEKYIEPFFIEYNDYHSIEKTINKIPINFCEIMSWDDKRLILGLLLTQYIDNENWNRNLKLYKDYYLDCNEKLIQKRTDEINKVIHFINENDCKPIIENGKYLSGFH